MRCPVCGRTLTEMAGAALLVDVCRSGCGGVWFDQGELEKVDSLAERSGALLLEIHRQPGVLVDHVKDRRCPRCGSRMVRRSRKRRPRVEVDQCSGCGGVWLDAGELRMLRGQYFTTERHKEEAEAAARRVFAPILREIAGTNEPGCVREIARILRIFSGRMR